MSVSFTSQEYDVTTPYYPFFAPLSLQWSDDLYLFKTSILIRSQGVVNGRLKTSQIVKLFAHKVVAVAYERWTRTRRLKYSDDSVTFGILENWSFTRGGRLQEVVPYERWFLTRGGSLREVVAY